MPLRHEAASGGLVCARWRDDFLLPEISHSTGLWLASPQPIRIRAPGKHAAHWVITVDTDERIVTNGEDIRVRLAESTFPVWMMRHDGGSYTKERCIRADVTARWSGPTHECFPALSRNEFGRARFSEVAKTHAQYLAKFRRDAGILIQYTQKHPDDPRWFYYLGESFKNLAVYESNSDRYLEAIRAYCQCADRRGWNEESAWACFRAAECYCALEQWEDAVGACAYGLSLHAGLAELPWLASYACSKKGLWDQAVYWARLSAAMGLYRGRGRDVPRVGFRAPNALYEGPYDVLRFAYRALNDEHNALWAEAEYYAATAAREAAEKETTP